MFYHSFDGKQPAKSFVADLLRPMHGETPKKWNKRERANGEIFISSIALSFSFPDESGLLESVYLDFREFLKSAKIAERADGIKLVTAYEQTQCFECYRLSITEKEILLTAGDTEGIRRGLLFLEDECMRREGSFLPLGKIERKPFLKTRISRCCFSPPSHNDNDGMQNELASEID